MDTKEKEKKIRLRFYNIVIHPSDKHKPEFYIQLFDKIRDLGTAYATATDKKRSCVHMPNLMILSNVL